MSGRRRREGAERARGGARVSRASSSQRPCLNPTRVSERRREAPAEGAAQSRGGTDLFVLGHDARCRLRRGRVRGDRRRKRGGRVGCRGDGLRRRVLGEMRAAAGVERQPFEGPASVANVAEVGRRAGRGDAHRRDGRRGRSGRGEGRQGARDRQPPASSSCRRSTKGGARGGRTDGTLTGPVDPMGICVICPFGSTARRVEEVGEEPAGGEGGRRQGGRGAEGRGEGRREACGRCQLGEPLVILTAPPSVARADGTD